MDLARGEDAVPRRLATCEGGIDMSDMPMSHRDDEEEPCAACEYAEEQREIRRMDRDIPFAHAPTLVEWRERVGPKDCRWCEMPLPDTIESDDHPDGWPVRGFEQLQW